MNFGLFFIVLLLVIVISALINKDTYSIEIEVKKPWAFAIKIKKNKR